MAKKQTQKRNQKALLATLIPLGVISAATAVTLPIVLNKKVDADAQNVETINSLLDAEIEEHGHFQTMSNVISFLKTKEVSLEELSTNVSNGQYIWDKNADKIFIMDGDGKVAVGPSDYTMPENKSVLWKMVTAPAQTNKLFAYRSNADIHADSFDSKSKFSQYLRKDDSYVNTKLTFCSGIDTGDNTDILLKLVKDETIETPEDSVTITTNGCCLIIESTSYTEIDHYGSLLDLKVETLVEGGSFNATSESEIVGDVVIEEGVKGKFVAEPDSIVNAIFVADAQTKVQVYSENVGTISPTTETAAEAINDIVEISEIIEEEDKPKVVETEQPEPTIYDLSGLGTERSPYILTQKSDFARIHDYYDKGYTYFKYLSNTMEIDGSDWETNGLYGDLYGSFDGSGLIINNLSRPLFNVIGHDKSKENEVMKISNVTLKCDIALPGATAGVVKYLDRNAVFENVDVHGYISGATHVGGYACYGPACVHDESYENLKADWKFINCHSDAIISATGSNPYVSGFVAHRFANDDSTYTFDDSIFTGVINGTSDFTEGETHCCYSYFVTGPMEYCVKVRTHYSSNFITTYGNPENVKYKLPSVTFNETIEGTEYKCFYTGIDGTLSKYAPDYQNKKDKYVRSGYIAPYCRNKITLVTQSIPASPVGIVQVEKQTGAEFAYASLFIGPNGKIASHVNLLKSFEYEDMQEVTSGDSTLYQSTTIKNFNVYVNDPNHTTPGIQGDDYVIYDTDTYSQTTDPVKYILVIQYKQDNAGRYIPFYTTKLTW